jgi:hypothetical protein
LIAGLVEGFVSASGLSLGIRLVVSMASAVFLLLYLTNGARHVGRASARAPSLSSVSP